MTPCPKRSAGKGASSRGGTGQEKKGLEQEETRRARKEKGGGETQGRASETQTLIPVYIYIYIYIYIYVYIHIYTWKIQHIITFLRLLPNCSLSVCKPVNNINKHALFCTHTCHLSVRLYIKLINAFIHSVQFIETPHSQEKTICDSKCILAPSCMCARVYSCVYVCACVYGIAGGG